MKVIGSFGSKLCFCDCNVNVDLALLSKGIVCYPALFYEVLNFVTEIEVYIQVFET